jgi:hypothetical protein
MNIDEFLEEIISQIYRVQTPIPADSLMTLVGIRKKIDNRPDHPMIGIIKETIESPLISQYMDLAVRFHQVPQSVKFKALFEEWSFDKIAEVVGMEWEKNEN